MWEAPPLPKLQEALASPSNPIGMRMRAAYFLRQAYENAIRNTPTDENIETTVQQINDDDHTLDDIVIKTLGECLINNKHGSLLRHEFAYIMGQLRDERCCPCLEQVLSDTTDCVMVRHECAEALGAIGSKQSIPILEHALEMSPNTPEIGETCRIAIDYLLWKQDGANDENDNEEEKGEAPMLCACMASPYSSIDPAPPHPKHVNLSTSKIGSILRDDSIPLFERYRAMFSLRNRGGSECVYELGKTLVEDTSSALLRHEVAYVLGQMQHPDSVDALSESLQREDEHEMVRHESAEALGSIEGRWEDVEVVLKQFINDKDDVVRDSCIVALDAADYWGYNNATATIDK